MPMGAHQHHVHKGESLQEAARERLTSRGEQWTDMRASVFEALAGFDRPASAYDIAEAVSNKQGRRVAANSVIASSTCSSERTRAAGGKRQRLCRHAHPDCLHDCIFLICDTCGQAVHIDDDALSGGVRKAAASAGFSASRPVIEVRGTCGDCGEAEPAPMISSRA